MAALPFLGPWGPQPFGSPRDNRRGVTRFDTGIPMLTSAAGFASRFLPKSFRQPPLWHLSPK